MALLFALSSCWSSSSPGFVQLSTQDYQRLVQICEQLKTLNETLLNSSQKSTEEIETLKKEIETMQSELTDLKNGLSQAILERQDLNRKLLEAEEQLLRAQTLLQNSEKSLIAQSLLIQKELIKWKVATIIVATVATIELVGLLSCAAKALVPAD